MSWLSRTLRSSIGSKCLMALTGLGLIGFLLAHLSGNLLVFAGADAFNEYAHKLKSLGPVLWIARIGLLATAVLHVLTAIKLTVKNRAARPVQYAYRSTLQASYASRTMPMSGAIVFVFILFHLAHYTFHFTNPEFSNWIDEKGRHDAFRMLVYGFQNPLVSGFYIFGMILIGMHLSHGFQSAFQSLGINHVNINRVLKCGGSALAWLIVFGFISIPMSVLAGIVSVAEGMQ